MKALRIEFVPARAVPWAWGCALAIAAGASTTALVQVARFERDRSAVQARTASFAVARPGAPPKAASSVVNEQQARAAVRLLQADPNRALADVENLQEPGAQLQSLSLDNVGGVVRLDYVLDSVPRAVSVTALLNAGRPSAAWTLERWSTMANAQSPHGAPSGSLRASWVSAPAAR